MINCLYFAQNRWAYDKTHENQPKSREKQYALLFVIKTTVQVHHWASFVLWTKWFGRKLCRVCISIPEFFKETRFFQFNYSIVYFSTCTPFRLNQSLSWPFREVVATALYDFTPREPNQLPLRQGCQVLVIGKEGDSKGWWRGKTMERVSVNCTNSWCAPLPNCKLIEFWILFSRLDSFQKSTSVSIRRLQRSYDVTITWYFFPWHGNHHNPVIQITTQATNTIQKHRLSPGSVQCRLAHQHDRFHRLHRLLVAHRVVKNRARVLQNEWIYVYLSNCKADGSFSMEKCRWNEWETREKRNDFQIGLIFCLGGNAHSKTS